MFACRNALLALHEKDELQCGCNAGLILARYLKEKQDGNKAGSEAREALLSAVVRAVNVGKDSSNFYKLAFKRRGEILGGTSGTFKITNGRMIIGLGGSSVLETGLTLNHVFGTPFIPGSALKGLAAHYCSDVWGKNPQFPNFKGPVRNNRGVIVVKAGGDYDFMFGSTDDAGFLTFHDAWLKPASLSECLVPDVMTPHHSNYYSLQGKEAPTDFDDPNPVTFLSIRGEFEIRVSCDSEGKEGKDWEQIAMKLLKQALENWGIGGKTSSGYGVGGFDYEGASGHPADAVGVHAQPFSPGQHVEAVYIDKNKKGNPQIEVNLNTATIKARWEGDVLDLPKGTTIQAIVKSYDPSRTPPLILGPSREKL